jgi:hypothetical protein
LTWHRRGIDEDSQPTGASGTCFSTIEILIIPILGIIIPKMGINESGSVTIQAALFTRVQQRVLGILFGQPDRRFQGTELIRMAQSGTGAVHRQLTSLASSGLVNITRIGNQKYYQANPDSPVFDELCGLLQKTVGLREPRLNLTV